MKFLLLFMLPALAATGSSIRDVCLPPWYDQAAFQRVELELEDLAANYVQLHQPDCHGQQRDCPGHVAH